MTHDDEDFTERLTTFFKLRITAASPDRSVRAGYAHGEGLSLTLEPERLREHTEAELARQVAAAITRVRTGYRKAMRLLPRPPRREAADEAEREQYRRRWEQLCARISVEVDSPRRLAKLRITGTGEIGCGIRREVLRGGRIEPTELERELCVAYQRAVVLHDRRLRQADEKLNQRHQPGS